MISRGLEGPSWELHLHSPNSVQLCESPRDEPQQIAAPIAGVTISLRTIDLRKALRSKKGYVPPLLWVTSETDPG